MRTKRTFKIKARRDVSCPETYANFCEATHSPFDLALTFCCLSGIQPEDVTETGDGGDGVVYADPKTRIVLPFRIVPALIKMLETQMRAVEEGEEEEPSGLQQADFPVVH